MIVCPTCEEPPAGAAEDAEQGGAQVLVQEQEQQGVDDRVHEGHMQGHLDRLSIEFLNFHISTFRKSVVQWLSTYKEKVMVVAID